jgi:hypothetical protein
VGWLAGLSGEDGDRQACVGWQVHRLEVQGRIADDKLMEALAPTSSKRTSCAAAQHAELAGPGEQIAC